MPTSKLQKLIKTTPLAALKESATVLGGAASHDVALVLDINAPIEDRANALIRCWDASHTSTSTPSDADSVAVTSTGEVRP